MKFMETCYLCKTKVKEAICIKEGFKLKCLKCPKCGEEYFTSSELVKFDILTGKRKMIRRFGILGESPVIRVPEKIMADFRIRQGDYGVFEERPEGILIKPIHAKELK